MAWIERPRETTAWTRRARPLLPWGISGADDALRRVRFRHLVRELLAYAVCCGLLTVEQALAVGRGDVEQLALGLEDPA